jgi:large subunit ribosomal protein L10
MRAEKELLKQEVVDKFHQFPSFVVMQYAKLTANTANDFRREVRKMGGDVEVMRKRVLVKAANDAGISLDASSLQGHIGIVFFGKDALEGTKTVFKFSQDREKVIQVIGGRFDGQLYSGEDVERLSKLPSQTEMRAQFLGLLEAPLAQTLAVIEALLASVPHCLENKSKAEESPKE